MDIRKIALGLATFVGGAAALTAAAVALGRRQPDGAGVGEPQPLRTSAADGPAPAREQVREPAATGAEGHAAPDLAGAAPIDIHARAPEAFRPDMDAPMTAAEREALRPATGPSPTLVDAGTSLPAG